MPLPFPDPVHLMPYDDLEFEVPQAPDGNYYLYNQDGKPIVAFNGPRKLSSHPRDLCPDKRAHRSGLRALREKLWWAIHDKIFGDHGERW